MGVTVREEDAVWRSRTAWNGGVTYMGQTITPEEGTIYLLHSIRVYGDGTWNSPVCYFGICKTKSDYNLANGMVIGTSDLPTITVTNDPYGGSFNALFDMTKDANLPIYLSSLQMYFFYIVAAGTVSGQFHWGTTDNNYTRGEFVSSTNSGTSWTTNPSSINNIRFQVYGTLLEGGGTTIVGGNGWDW